MSTSIIIGRTPSSLPSALRHKALKVAHAMLFCTLAITTVQAYSQEHQAGAAAQYRIDRENCLNGRTDEDQKTCLKEAGAALDASRRGQLNDNNTQYEKNAALRCQALNGDDRDACLRRMQGEGSVSGSVAKGGLLRELVTPVPDTQSSPASTDTGG